MDTEIGMEVIDGRDALGVILFREEGDQIVTEIKAMKIPTLDLAKLCMQLGRALKAKHDAESADSETGEQR
jgi:hypothetical protein